MVDLQDIRSRTLKAKDYIFNMDGKEGDMFQDEYEEYSLDMEVAEELKDFVDKVSVVVLSAAWCKDCRGIVPVLARLEEAIGLDVMVFGKIKTAPLDPDHQWRIPPSPPEAEEWGVKAIPWVEVFDKSGNKIGTIIEKVTKGPNFEAELLDLIKG